MDQFPPDGLMGMGFKEISEFGADPVFQTLVAEGATSVSEFAFKLASSGSELFLGGVDNQAFVNGFTQVPVTTLVCAHELGQVLVFLIKKPNRDSGKLISTASAWVGTLLLRDYLLSLIRVLLWYWETLRV